MHKLPLQKSVIVTQLEQVSSSETTSLSSAGLCDYVPCRDGFTLSKACGLPCTGYHPECLPPIKGPTLIEQECFREILHSNHMIESCKFPDQAPVEDTDWP
ncbi:hypothetical protein FOZ62_008440, partial [Perkinsus olseni]